MTINRPNPPTWTNWLGNQSFSPEVIIEVNSESEMQRQIAKAAAAGKRVRSFGGRHSVTPIVETDDVLLNLDKMRGILHIDPHTGWVTALPRTTVAEFGAPLWAEGLSLQNQGDIDTQAIAGAIATATHGAGRHLPSFSASLKRARLIDGMGNLVEIDQSMPDELAAVQTSIGLLGMMTELTIEAVPAYELHQTQELLPFAEMLNRFDEYLDAFRSFTFYWCPTDHSAKLFGLDGAKADECLLRLFREPSPDLDRSTLSPDERVGPAYQIFPLVYEPNFLEMEYFLPLDQAQDILQEMRKLMLRWLPEIYYPLEVRNVSAETAWLSPQYQRDNLVVSVCVEPGSNNDDYFRACDALFSEFNGRPHWGKLHFMTAERLAGLFPRYNDFVAMRRRFDPNGTFLNKQLRDLFA